MISAGDIIALLPILVISATAVLVMMGIAWKRSHVLAAGLTFVGLASGLPLDLCGRHRSLPGKSHPSCSWTVSHCSTWA